VEGRSIAGSAAWGDEPGGEEFLDSPVARMRLWMQNWLSESKRKCAAAVEHSMERQPRRQVSS
jgi:hypothetical protein